MSENKQTNDNKTISRIPLSEMPEGIKKHLLKNIFYSVLFIILALFTIPLTKDTLTFMITAVVIFGVMVFFIYNQYLAFSYGKIREISGECIDINNVKIAQRALNIHVSKKITIEDKYNAYVFYTSDKKITYGNIISVYISDKALNNLQKKNGAYDLTGYVFYEITDASTNGIDSKKKNIFEIAKSIITSRDDKDTEDKSN